MKILTLLSLVCLAISDVPPEHWQEHWFDHKQLLTRVYYDTDVAIYFDNDVDKSLKWMDKYLHDVWVYTKKVYGSFSADQRLFAVFHTGKYGGGHPSTYFDSSHDYRNVIDCGTPDRNAWHTGAGNELDMTTHEVSHIVEGSSHGVHNSPAFPIWGDSKWAEIFIYDVYNGLNRPADAKRWHDMQSNNHDNFPRANTYWFRDWFFPIYEQHGGSAALNAFFQLLSENFPKNHGASNNRPQYTRDMNHGEFFHFWSGAAKTNLKSLATKAFGWSDAYEKEFNQARKDFPNIKY
jgi:hypothetical protein